MFNKKLKICKNVSPQNCFNQNISFMFLDVLTNASMVSAKDFLLPLTLGGALRSTIATASIVKKSIVSKNNEFGGFSNLETVTQSSVMRVSLL